MSTLTDDTLTNKFWDHSYIDHALEPSAAGHTTSAGFVYGINRHRYPECDGYGCEEVVVSQPLSPDVIGLQLGRDAIPGVVLAWSRDVGASFHPDSDREVFQNGPPPRLSALQVHLMIARLRHLADALEGYLENPRLIVPDQQTCEGGC